MNEMIGRMLDDETVVVGTALADFLTVVAFAVFVVLFTAFVLPYMRRYRQDRTD